MLPSPLCRLLPDGDPFSESLILPLVHNFLDDQPGVTFADSTVEEAALAWLEAAGWQIVHGPDIGGQLDRQTPS